VRIALEDLEIAPRAPVGIRDLWRRADVGEAQGEIVIGASANSATVLRIRPS